MTNKTNLFIFVALLGILVATSTLVGAFLVHGAFYASDSTLQEQTNVSSQPVKTIENDLKPTSPVISFQQVVDNFVQKTTGNRSVVIYDLDNEQIVGLYNPDNVYNTASLYKLFVVYEGYRRLNDGTWKRDESVGTSGKTILECLDLAIRESNSVCGEGLWSMIGHDELNSIIDSDFNIHNSDISNLSSTPNDILKMMKTFYYHKEIADKELIARMKDSMLNQPVTTYDWRQGLPSGFSRANVYNKVGWDYNADEHYWNIYHDAAIVEFPENNRKYIVVVMTNRVSKDSIRDFGKLFEEYFYTNQ